MPYAGQTLLIPIASTYNTAIFAGGMVKIVAAGTGEKFTVTTTGSPAGDIMVFQYGNPLDQCTLDQYYPGARVTKAFSIVVDDPLAAFKVAVTAADSRSSSAARASAGAQFSVSVFSGVTASGTSDVSVVACSNTTMAGLV